MTRRRFTEHGAPGFPKTLDPWHDAALDGHTVYQKRVIDAADAGALLKSGQHSRKLGKTVTKGKWRGMEIYSLTLEERATCPRSCQSWLTCYGNKMNWSERIRPGAALEEALDIELRYLGRIHPKGFVVRLHVLGDFYSTAYVAMWKQWIAIVPALRVFGYTAWPSDTPIGAAIAALRSDHWDRFAVRTSAGRIGEPRTTVLDRVVAGPTHDGGIVCPAQTGATECCGTCALCWGTQRDIVFLRH